MILFYVVNLNFNVSFSIKKVFQVVLFQNHWCLGFFFLQAELENNQFAQTLNQYLRKTQHSWLQQTWDR